MHRVPDLLLGRTIISPTAVPNWSVDEIILIGDGETLRIVGITTGIDEELLEQGFNGVFTVEPA